MKRQTVRMKGLREVGQGEMISQRWSGPYDPLVHAPRYLSAVCRSYRVGRETKCHNDKVPQRQFDPGQMLSPLVMDLDI